MSELTEVNHSQPSLQEVVTAFTKINFDDNFVDLNDTQWELVDKVMRDTDLALTPIELFEAKTIMLRYEIWKRRQ